METIITFDEALRRFREGDPNVTKWWIETIEAIANSIIKPFTIMGLDSEDLKQEVFLIVYGKLNSLDKIVNIAYLGKFTRRYLTYKIAHSHGMVVSQLNEYLNKIKCNVYDEDEIQLNNSQDIDRLSNNLRYDGGVNRVVYKVDRMMHRLATSPL